MAEETKNSYVLNLFCTYDRSGIGEISKKNLLSYFRMIDKRITEKWLAKNLIEQGIKLGSFITYRQFAAIVEVIQNIEDGQRRKAEIASNNYSDFL